MPSGLTLGQKTILRKIDDRYNHLQSLRTRFTERYIGMGMNRSEAGTLLLMKPGRMVWHYNKPAGKVFIFDGKFAWFYTPGDPQAQKIPAKQMDDLHTPLRFLLGHTKLEKELDGLAVSSDGDQLSISGVPKGMASRIRKLLVRATSAGIITEMQVEELDGARTEFSFDEIHENVPVSDRDFTFIPPPGVTIVSGTSPT